MSRLKVCSIDFSEWQPLFFLIWLTCNIKRSEIIVNCWRNCNLVGLAEPCRGRARKCRVLKRDAQIYHLRGQAGERWMGYFSVTPVNLVKSMTASGLWVKKELGCISWNMNYHWMDVESPSLISVAVIALWMSPWCI